MRRFNLNYLLIFIPIAVALYWYGANSLLVFVMAALTIVPLSKIVGNSTETHGDYLGPTYGRLLNASMGNAPELIIGAFALKNGLITVVKALAHAHGLAFQPAGAGGSHDFRVHRAQYDDRRGVRLAGRGHAHRGLLDARHRVLLR
jgi:hypothetical protein